MKCTVLFASPRPEGNTAFLTDSFVEECQRLGVETEQISLYGREIRPCLGCMACQDCLNELGCVQRDDVDDIFSIIQASDLLVLATPIYAWYCTPPMKTLADRIIYAGNKKYGAVSGAGLLEGKRVATIVTCGYPIEKGADLWESGLKRWCRHSNMTYEGMLAGRDMGKGVPFSTPENRENAWIFARKLYQSITVEEI